MNTARASEISGVTPRMLQYWDEIGYCIPARNGHARDYSNGDLQRIDLIRACREKKLDHTQIIAVLQCAKTLQCANTHCCYIGFEGTNVFPFSSANAAIQWATERKHAVHLIER